jgi:hypothetical protein
MPPEERLDMTKQKKQSTEAAVRDIRRRTRRKFSPEEKIRIVLEGLRGEQSVTELGEALEREARSAEFCVRGTIRGIAIMRFVQPGGIPVAGMPFFTVGTHRELPCTLLGA